MKSVENDGIWTIYGKSTDTKPSPLGDSSPYEGQPIIFYEMDTKKAFMYDYDDHVWIEQ